jgi:hypothetical protein
VGSSKLDLFSLLAQQGVRRGAGLMSDIEKLGQLKRKPTFWDSLMIGGLGAIDPSLSSQYLDTKLDRQNEALQRQEGRETIAGIESAANLKTQAEQDAINRQLGINQQNLASTFSVSGGVRTGNYQRKVGELGEQAVKDIAGVAGQNALTAKMMELGYTQNVQNFNLELAKLESAKASGDAQMAGVAAENLAPLLYDLLFKPKGELPTSNAEFGPELPTSHPITLDNMSPPSSSPTLDYIRNLYKPKPKSSAGMFAPQQDNTDPISILWGT